MNSLLLAIGIIFIYSIGFMDDSRFSYQFLSSAFPNGILLKSVFSPLLLNYGKGTPYLPTLFGFTFHPQWLFVATAFLFCGISWLYNAKTLRIRKNYWSSELILLLLFALFVFLQAACLDAPKHYVENHFSTMVPALELWLLTGIFLSLIFAHRKVSVTKMEHTNSPFDFLVNHSNLTPALAFTAVGTIGLLVMTYKINSPTPSMGELFLILGNFVVVALSVALWIDLADYLFNKRKTAITIVTLIVVLVFPQIFLNVVSEDNFAPLIASPLTWSSAVKEDGAFVAWCVHLALFLTLIFFWYKKGPGKQLRAFLSK